MIKPGDVTDKWIEFTIVPRALAPSIGRIAINYASLDHEVNTLIHFLIKTDEKIGMAITQTIMNVKDRLALAETIFNITRPTVEQKHFKLIADGIRLAIDDRNRMKNIFIIITPQFDPTLPSP